MVRPIEPRLDEFGHGRPPAAIDGDHDKRYGLGPVSQCHPKAESRDLSVLQQRS